MQDLILTLHIIVCVLLVILILLQSGKEGMGVIFGGGNSSMFGSTGAGGILAKLTTLMAVIFVITSLSYTYVTSSRPAGESTILNVRIEETPPDAAAREASGQAASGQTASGQTASGQKDPAGESAAQQPAADGQEDSGAKAATPKPEPTEAGTNAGAPDARRADTQQQGTAPEPEDKK